mgnify:CR=1 FL=1
MADAFSADRRLPWLKLASMNWLGATLAAGLIKEFETPQRAFRATKGDLLAIKGWDIRRAERFVAEAARVEPVCPPEVLDRKDVRLVTFNDEEYPALLREIPDSPVALFVRGRLDFGNAPAIAIVGARNGTQMGYDIARDFGCRLARAGFVVVSGLALGVDTVAHRAAIDAGGRTLAVLGSGLDQLYPPQNRGLAQAIAGQGAVISDYPLGTRPDANNFPPRNRIISG